MSNNPSTNPEKTTTATTLVPPGGTVVEAGAPTATNASTKENSALPVIKDTLAAAQSLFTIAAIIATGIWFLLQGQNHPKLKLEHRLSHRTLAKISGKVLLGVDILVSNVGNVRLQLDCGHLKIFDVNSAKDSGPAELIWPTSKDNPCLGSMRIEPGEGDQVHEEIPIRADIRTVRVQSFFKNPDAAVKGDGWEYISLYDLESTTHSTSQSTTPQPIQSAPPSSHQ